MDKRQRAFLAMLVFAVDRTFISIININRESFSQSGRLLGFNILTIIFLWLLPILIAYRFEHRGLESLGLRVPESRFLPYLSFGVLGILMPSLFLGSQNLFSNLVEQILFIGLPEEIFYRGYIMTRLCEWKDDKVGLFLNSVLFSFAHIVFIVSNEGLRYPLFMVTTTLQTFIGGLLLGHVFLREGNVAPGAIIHVSMNLYLSRIFG